MTICIPTPPDFSFLEILSAHGWRRLAPFVWDEDAQTLSRPDVLDNGTVIALTLRDDGGDAVRVEVTGSGDEAEIVRRVRRRLRLDLPIDGFHAYCRMQPVLAHLEQYRRGRLLRCPTLFEDTLKIDCKVSVISTPKTPDEKTTSAPSLWQITLSTTRPMQREPALLAISA